MEIRSRLTYLKQVVKKCGPYFIPTTVGIVLWSPALTSTSIASLLACVATVSDELDLKCRDICERLEDAVRKGDIQRVQQLREEALKLGCTCRIRD